MTMKRHDDDLALHLAESGEPDATLEPELAALVGDFRRVLGALKIARKEPPAMPPHLERWARAWVDTRLPEPEGLVSRILSVLATNAPAPAVRNGHAGGSAVLYGDEKHHVDLRVEPTENNGHRLRGQILGLDRQADEPWHISLVGPDGSMYMVDTDATGEFAIEGVPVTTGTSFVAQRGDERLVVARLEELEPIEA
jgi:hypothetical protein